MTNVIVSPATKLVGLFIVVAALSVRVNTLVAEASGVGVAPESTTGVYATLVEKVCGAVQVLAVPVPTPPGQPVACKIPSVPAEQTA
jgi:hypothetical protein